LLLGEDLAIVSSGSTSAQNVCLGWEVLLTVVTLPPVKGLSSDQEVEDESEDEPEGVLSYFWLVDCQSEQEDILAYLCLLAGSGLLR
jgi:hypothetical protein